jgi:hypothetical protein
LVEIERDVRDARLMRIYATARGVRLIKRGRQRRIEYLAVHLNALTRGELAKLGAAAQILEKILHDSQ